MMCSEVKMQEVGISQEVTYEVYKSSSKGVLP